MAYDTARKRLREATEKFGLESSPTRTQLLRLDAYRRAFDSARAALEKHLKEHPPGDPAS